MKGECAAAWVAVATLMMSANGLQQQTCFFPERSGCTSGNPPIFCGENAVMCDVGYSDLIDTGCGKLSPVNALQDRKCFTIQDVLTQDCDLPTPAGYQVVGCRSAGGVCCYAKKLNSATPNPGGKMHVPTGGPCCEIIRPS